MAAWNKFCWTLLGALVLLLRSTNGSNNDASLRNSPLDHLQSSDISSDTGSEQLSAGRTIDLSAATTDNDKTKEVYLKPATTRSSTSSKLSSSVTTLTELKEANRKTRAISVEQQADVLDRTKETRHIDDNNVGVGQEYLQIHPTKTSSSSENLVNIVSMTEKWVWNGEGGGKQSGEGYRVPRGRQLSLLGPNGTRPVTSSDNDESAAEKVAIVVKPTEIYRGNERKTNPDIQDIITGIVKLLNGNVKVQPDINAGTGRPLRPINTRINNRGPPRISELPSNFDSSEIPISTPDDIGMLPPPPPRLPPPYPFEPTQNEPYEEQTPFPENAHQNPTSSVIPLPPQPSGIKPYSGTQLPEQVVPVQNRPSGSQTQGNRPQNQDNRPFGPQNRPIGPQNRPQNQPSNDSNRPQTNRPLIRPRPWPRPQLPPNKLRRPQPNTSVNKKPHNPNEGEIVFGNKKKEPQYVTVGQFGQEDDDTNVGISLTMGGNDDAMDDVTFTTNTPPVEVTNQTVQQKTNTSDIIKNKTIEPLLNLTNVNSANLNTTKPSLNVTQVIVKNVTNDIITGVPKIIASMTSSSSTVNEATVVKEVKKEDVIVKETINSTKPLTGFGEVHPVIESSMSQDKTTNQQAGAPTTRLPSGDGKPQFNTGYRPRPGIVLDDTEYKPLGAGRPIITAPPNKGHVGEVFDVTVSAIQGPSLGNTGKPYIYPVEIEGVKLPGGGQGEVSVITAAEEGQHFVSIDGKRTYINLFGDNTDAPSQPTQVQQSRPTTLGAGFVVPAVDEGSSKPVAAPRPPHRPHPPRRPANQPPVRIDTCIVGDDSTCDVQQNEKCLTEKGVSSCHCRPSYSRRKHREPCRRVVSIAMSLRVDKMYDKRVTWTRNLQSQDSEEYRLLQYEASRALDSAMSMTPFSDEFMSAKVLNIYSGNGPEKDDGQPGNPGSVFVNVTLQLEENADTSRPTVRHDIQRHLLGVIHRRNNNVGDSALWVDSPPGSISQLQDIDECSSADLHDCNKEASCSNVFGSFRCLCSHGTRDPWNGNVHKQGRQCEVCSAEHCNNRGSCRYDPGGQQTCSCSSGFYGAQCEIDGEVLGVAIGASVAAVIIIVLTLVCLCMWSRRWSREQKNAAGLGSPVFGYMAAGGSTVKTPAMGAPPYQVSLEDRLRWAQIADVMAQANHYAPEPANGPTRPSSAVFGYPNLGTLPHMSQMGTMQPGSLGTMGSMSHAGTLGGKMPLPPIPMPRMNIPHNMQTLNRSQATMSVHGGYSMHGGTFNPHQGMRTPDCKKTFDSSSSDEEDRTDLLGRNFHVPRPKSRSSVANQSGIYYDVDFEQADLYASKQHNIPMSTYGTGRNQYFMQ